MKARVPTPTMATATCAHLVPTSGICLACGCTDDRACAGGCSWVDRRQTICSRCAEAMINALADWLHSRATE